MIDHVTRYSAAAVIRPKKKDVIIDNVFKHWVTLFGCPKKIIADNGGEFNNEPYHVTGELLNTRILTMVAEAIMH